MITPSFNSTATERVLPKLALDFTTANLDSRITFTRTTNATNPATYTNSSGYIVAATDNQPRFDYNPITLACKGLLIEESRQNKLLNSEQFNQSPWSNVRSNISADVAVSPSNLTNADKLIEDTSTNSHYILQDFTNTSNTTYTVTVYAKAAGRRYFRVVGSTTANANSQYANFDLTVGTAGTPVGGATANISAAGNDWYRCSVTFTSNTDATYRVSMWLLNDSQGTSYTGDGTSGAYLWGAQLEQASFSTSYIPTTTTALTRNADVATMTGTNFSSWFTDPGTITMQWSIPYSVVGNRGPLWINAGVNSRGIGIYYASANAITGVYRDATGLSFATSNQSPTYPTTQASFGFSNTALGFSRNGLAPATATSSTVATATVNQLQFGYCNVAGSNTGYISGTIQKFNFYPSKLTDAQIQAFSKQG